KYPDIKSKIDMSFAREEHKDFCVPITMIDEESDSIPEITSQDSEEKEDISIKITSSESMSGSLGYEKKGKLRHFHTSSMH
ncbi:hypothetical protein HHI36_005882, partial [Cryptolaemus montrouzieri]